MSIAPVRMVARYRCLPVGDFNEGTVSEVFWMASSDVSCFIIISSYREFIVRPLQDNLDHRCITKVGLENISGAESVDRRSSR